jgi:MOSC domain-containing protein YiiM
MRDQGKESQADRGEVVAIHVVPRDGDPLRSVDRASLVAEKGIEGDRYFGRPAYRNVTVVAEADVQAACAAIGVEYRAGCTRRNITVRGLDVMALLGKEFRVGGARLLATRPCEPCDMMETSVGPGARDQLVHRAGIRAQVLDGGDVRIGDAVVPLHGEAAERRR